MPKYKHIFWDLDHTLWDFESNSVAALQLVYDTFLLAQKGVDPFPAFNNNYHKHNDVYWDRFRKGFITREKMRWKRMYVTLLDYKIADEPLAKQMGEAYLEFLPQQTHLFAYATKILEAAKNTGIQQHIITNGFEDTQIQKMTNSNILHFFTHIVTSEKAMSLKPNPEMYQHAMQLASTKAAESLMIGDAIDVDIAGAFSVNMDNIWFNPHNIQSALPRTFEVQHLQQIEQYIL